MTVISIADWGVILFGIIVPVLLVLNIMVLVAIYGAVNRISKLMPKKPAEAKVVKAPDPVPAPVPVPPITKVAAKK